MSQPGGLPSGFPAPLNSARAEGTAARCLHSSQIQTDVKNIYFFNPARKRNEDVTAAILLTPAVFLISAQAASAKHHQRWQRQG